MLYIERSLGGSVRKFDYRSPRFAVDLLVRLTIEGPAAIARCIEISSEGMRLESEQPLPDHALGTVWVQHRELTLELNVRVAHVGKAHSGVEFIYRSDGERKAVAQLIGSLEGPRKKLGPGLIS
jgi:hypothetical protein